MTRKLGITYLVLAAATILFQIAVALGAPLGAFTQGGEVTGSLGPSGRVNAVASIVFLAMLAMIVDIRAEVFKSRPTTKRAKSAIWVVLVFSFLEFVVNWITPSAPERMVWGPVNTVMLGCVVGIIVLSRRK